MKTKHLRRVLAATLLATTGAAAFAGIGGFGQNRSVGGVMIEATGNVRTATPEERRELATVLRDQMKPLEGDLSDASSMRVISLKGLVDEIAKTIQTNLPASDDLVYLAGLQQVDYVLVDRENHDICIAGPAEPWTVRDDGSVVGKNSNEAPMRLVDLMVALQSVETARNGGISCSIEPTPEGRRNLQAMLRKVKLSPGQDPTSIEPAMRQAFGSQIVHLNGVSNDSRLARTMVAADFEMKRIAMGLTPSPVAELPSYLELSKNSRHSGAQNPRWWMTCDYESIAHDQAGTAFKISGNRVKTLTEQDSIAPDGTASSKKGKKDVWATAWAEKMTEQFDELSESISVFADLENVMDASVVATLIVQEDLAKEVGLELTSLYKPTGAFEPVAYAVPQSIDPQCSFIRGRAGWVVTASGGVDISSFSVVEQKKIDSALSGKLAELSQSSDSKTSWWWNAR
jgi:hypothetical protein